MVMILLVAGAGADVAAMLARARAAQAAGPAPLVIEHDPHEAPRDAPAPLDVRILPLEELTAEDSAELQLRVGDALGEMAEEATIKVESYNPLLDLNDEVLDGLDHQVMHVPLGPVAVRRYRLDHTVNIELREVRLPPEPPQGYWETHRDHSNRPRKGKDHRNPTHRGGRQAHAPSGKR
jgi:hypothetical protein